MIALARFLTRDGVARLIVAVTIALAAVSVYFARRVEQDDNVLAFLPKNEAEVKAFYEVSDRFGSLDVALVGVGSDDVFDADFLDRLKSATKKLNETDGIEYALTLTSVEDFTPDPTKGGITTDYLVNKLPGSPEEKEALRARVLANENVVGNLVSKDSKGVVLYCFLRHGADPHLGASKVRSIVDEAFPKEDKYWNGQPFISTYIYDVTQKDLKRLAPWACVAIILLIISSFRDIPGMLIALASTGMGIVMTIGLMGMLHMRSNLVLGSMPVILFALGSAPPVHILTRYYFHSQTLDNRAAIHEAIRDKGLVVIASAATVVAGLGSFVTMDIAPMRVFGVFTSIGIILTLVMAIVFVPAATRVFRLKGKPTFESAMLARVTARIVGFARQNRLAVLGGLVVIAGVCALGIKSVDTRMDNATFFDKGSPPDKSDRFMRERFGGSQFVQIWVQGDMTDPYVLREVQSLGDKIAGLPNVAGVNHIGQVLSTINDAMEGVKRIPTTPERAKLLMSFLAGKRAVSQLLADDRESALINVKLGTTNIDEVEKVVANIENVVRGQTVQAYVLADATGARGAEVKARQDAYVLSHALAVLRQAAPDADSRADAVEKALRPTGPQTLNHDRMQASLLTFIKSDEFVGDLPPDPNAAKNVADSVASLTLDPPKPALVAAVAKALDKPADDAAVVDVSDSLVRPLADLQHKEARHSQSDDIAEAAGVPAEDKDKVAAKLGDVLSDLELPKALLAANGAEPDGTMSATVTGLPVLYRGLSRSVEKNQLFSLLSAVLLVAITMTIAFRSISSGVLSAIPALFTIVAVYGGMGLAHIHLDIGTSMLASLIIGAGVDYAIHFLGAWQGKKLDDAATTAAEVSGPGIWTNALMVAAGFFVLTLGEARPLKHVGTLTALAMVVASLATFLLVPIFARKHAYINARAVGGTAGASAVNDRDAAGISHNEAEGSSSNEAEDSAAERET